MEKKEIMDDGIFLFSVEKLSIEDPIKYLEDKGIYFDPLARIILAKSSKAWWFKRIFSFEKKPAEKTKIAILDSKHISGIGTKHTAEDVFETVEKLNLLYPTPKLIFSVLEKLDAEDFIVDMKIDELVLLHKPVRIAGSNYVLNAHLSVDGCSYKATIGATYFFPKRKWEERTGFVFVID